MLKWTRVEYKDLREDLHVEQLWKKEGTNLVSKYKGAIFGIHETKGLVASLEENEMITSISIDEDATSNFELSLFGKYVLFCH